MDTPNLQLVRAVVHRLEVNKTNIWRTRIGITTFWTIVEDVIDALNQEPNLVHNACVSKSAFLTLQDELMGQINSLEDHIVHLNDIINLQKGSDNDTPSWS